MAKQNFVGLVVSQGKMAKTVKVRVQKKTYDKKVHKEIFKRKDYLVHDEAEMCKEGDIVRIESIPKILAQKFFAIAEIKVNKGQQFAMYDTMAREKVARETESLQQFLDNKERTQSIITQVEDLRKLEQIHQTFQSNPDADKDALVAEINSIKAKYNIKSWPSTEPLLTLDVQQAQTALSDFEKRTQNMRAILEEIMKGEHADFRREAIRLMKPDRELELIKPNIQRNLMRKYLLNPTNKCPVEY